MEAMRTPAADFAAFVVDFAAFGADFAAFGADFAAFGADFAAFGVDFAAFGVDFAAFGVDFAAFGVDFTALPAVFGFPADVRAVAVAFFIARFVAAIRAKTFLRASARKSLLHSRSSR